MFLVISLGNGAEGIAFGDDMLIRLRGFRGRGGHRLFLGALFFFSFRQHLGDFIQEGGPILGGLG